jgi:hypothetical protein
VDRGARGDPYQERWGRRTTSTTGLVALRSGRDEHLHRNGGRREQRQLTLGNNSATRRSPDGGRWLAPARRHMLSKGDGARAAPWCRQAAAAHNVLTGGLGHCSGRLRTSVPGWNPAAFLCPRAWRQESVTHASQSGPSAGRHSK